jgi:hypothetical protein
VLIFEKPELKTTSPLTRFSNQSFAQFSSLLQYFNDVENQFLQFIEVGEGKSSKLLFATQKKSFVKKDSILVGNKIVMATD